MKFKNLVITAILTFIGCVLFITSFAQTSFTIKGQIDPAKEGKLYILYYNNGKKMQDSLVVTHGSFSYQGEISAPSYATFAERNGHILMPVRDFFIDGGNITVKSDSTIHAAVISGGKSQEDLNVYYKTYDFNYDKVSMEMGKYHQEGNITAFDDAKKKMQVLAQEKNKRDSLFIQNHPDSYVAFYLWNQKRKSNTEPEIEPAFLHFSKQIRNSEQGKEITSALEISKRLNAGKAAPDFTLKDSLGHPLSLSSLKGKNVLLIFWYPFGRQFFQKPAFNVGRVARRFEGKNFTIVTVYYNFSTDGSRNEWLSLCKEFFPNVVNLEDFNGLSSGGAPVSAAAMAYGISIKKLPQAFLIDPAGKIVARHLNLLDEQLALKIEKLIK
jgi:hypothetical protein